MAFKITTSQLAAFAPRLAQADLAPMVDALNGTLTKFGLDQSARRIRYFMAQSFYETQGYTKWSENLVYTTPNRLVEVWPSRFTMTKGQTKLAYAQDYINNAQKLANLTYANRYGNGNEASGDGWNYRGRGGFHLTFKDNYTAYSKDVYGDLSIVTNPDLVAAPRDAFLSAGWFWNRNGLTALADADSFTQVTHVINGASGSELTNLVQQRMVNLTQANSIFKW